MKRWMMLAGLMVAMAGMVVVATAGEGSMGAVKTDLRTRTDPGDTYGSGPVAGFAILNTNADGNLIVNARLKSGQADTMFYLWVVIDGSNQGVVASLMTNRKGKGGACVELPLPDPMAETVDVRVVVDNWSPGNMPLPYVGYATSEETLPVKKMDMD